MHISNFQRSWPLRPHLSNEILHLQCQCHLVLLAHTSTTETCSEMLVLYLQVPLLQAERLTRYASSMCSCLISSGFTVSTQRQAAFSSCKRGAIILRCNVNHSVRYISQIKQQCSGLSLAKQLTQPANRSQVGSCRSLLISRSSSLLAMLCYLTQPGNVSIRLGFFSIPC